MGTLKSRLDKEIGYLFFVGIENQNEDQEINPTPQGIFQQMATNPFVGLDRHSYSWISLSFMWTHKNLILFPLDVLLDCLQAQNHFDQGNTWWCSLTILFICLPNLLYLLEGLPKLLSKKALNQSDKSTVPWTETVIFRPLFLHFITVYR